MKFSFKNKFTIFFFIYLIFRIIIFNINSAEWGDSYRILRATNFIENGSYPKDEKRPPLFSFFLILIPNNVDQIYGGRVLMILVSVFTVYLFYRLINEINIQFTEDQKLLSVILFAFNPLFVYWSMRIYADTFFLMICLLVFNIYFSNLKKNSYLKIALMSLFCFFGIMTRFEGYILVLAVFLSFVFEFFVRRDKKVLLQLLSFLILGFIIFLWSINTPGTYFKSPIGSSYVDEANRRTVGVFDILGFVLHLLFILGNFFSFYFIMYDKKKLIKFIQVNSVLFIFLVIELVLSFVWPAAVPRLMVQVVPILIILTVIGLNSYSEEKKLPYFIIFPLGIVVYFFGQFLIKSQFLLTNYYFMGVLILISIIQIYLLFKKEIKKFQISLIVGTIFWMFFFVYLHKDIYKVLNLGISYFSKEYKNDGVIVTNDVSALSKFYFGDNLKYLRQIDYGNDIAKYLKDKDAKYVLVTNEHNPDMKFSPEKYPYLETIYEHREEVNGREFFVVISKVKFD